MVFGKNYFNIDSEKLLQVSFDAIQDGISILDTDLTIIRVNKVMEKWYSPAMPIPGKKCYQAYHSFDKPCSNCPTLQTINTGKPAVEIVPLTQEGRQTGWLELFTYPLKDEHDNTVGVVEYVRDITKRKKLEQLLENSTEWYRTIAEDIPVLVHRLSRDMRFTFVNDAYCNFYGASSADIIDKEVFEFVPPENRSLVKEALLSLTPENPIQRHEHTNISGDGEARWIKWTNRALFDEEGKVKEYLCVGEDITEQKKAVTELRASEKRNRALVDALPDMLFLYSGDGIYLDVQTKNDLQLSEEGRQLYRNNFLIGSRIKEVMKPAIAEVVLLGIEETLRVGSLNFLEYSYSIDGQRHYFEARMVPVADNEVLSIVRDITERKEAEAKLNYQLEFEKMIAEISSAFVGATGSNIDKAIDHALELSGEFFSADRSYICRFSEDGLHMDNTHEWCAEEVPSMKRRNQGFLLENTPWWAVQLKRQDYVYVPDVEALPPEAEKDKIDFQIEGTKSFLTIPLVKEGITIGIFGFKMVKKNRLSEHQIALLKVVAEIIAGAIIKHETEVALKKSEERYRDILDTMEEAYYEADLKGNIVFSNDAGLKLFGGYSKEVAQGISYKLIYKDPKQAYEAFNKVFITGKPDKGLVLEMIRKDGSTFYGEISIALLKDSEGYVKGFKGIGKDVTERIENEKRLQYLSMHDHLTNIYNRTFFETELARLDKSREYPVTIISADLDGLKLINDTMGHEAGDKLLQGCALVLRKSLRNSDILARVGGDEFSAILPGTDKKTGETVVRRIRQNVNKYNQKNKELLLGISLGVATAEKIDYSLSDLFKRADDMMYRDKLYSSTSSRSKIVQSLLAALAERDYITEGHARRLEELCRAVGEKIELSSHQLSDLALLAQVHDLGKVGIPDTILFKPGPLNEEEWEIMRGHPEKGFRIASSSPDLSGVAELILKHHERCDGKGYPLGLKGTQIPVECRILAMVDAFDAMISQRPYNKTKTPEEAIKEIETCAGSQFDPNLVPVFLTILKELTSLNVET